ncbi:MAG: hypothetical protein WKF59_03885 [Chitinophagaceae bacterium]
MILAMQNRNGKELANNFERIADAEKTQWLPYYYAAYCNVMNAFMEQDKTKVDAIADKAEELITKAETTCREGKFRNCYNKKYDRICPHDGGPAKQVYAIWYSFSFKC